MRRAFYYLVGLYVELYFVALEEAERQHAERQRERGQR